MARLIPNRSTPSNYTSRGWSGFMCLVEAKNLDELSRGTRICLGVALLTVVVDEFNMCGPWT